MEPRTPDRQKPIPPAVVEVTSLLDVDVALYNEFVDGPTRTAFREQLTDAGYEHRAVSVTHGRHNQIFIASRVPFSLGDRSCQRHQRQPVPPGRHTRRRPMLYDLAASFTVTNPVGEWSFMRPNGKVTSRIDHVLLARWDWAYGVTGAVGRTGRTRFSWRLTCERALLRQLPPDLAARNRGGVHVDVGIWSVRRFVRCVNTRVRRRSGCPYRGVGAEYCAVPGQTVFRYSLMRPWHRVDLTTRR